MEGLIELLFYAVLFIILCAICVAVSLNKDKKKEKMLMSYLQSVGFVSSGETDIPDMQNSAKPYKFLVDFVSKKWVYAKYRAETSNIYDFSDIICYRVILRSKGTNIVMGEKRVLAPNFTANCGVLKGQGINKDNCDYIAFEVEFKGKPAAEVDTLWVMYENQESDGELRHSDFLVPSMCIESAVQLDEWLYKILRVNNS